MNHLFLHFEFEPHLLFIVGQPLDTTNRMSQVQGHCDARFSKLRDLMQEFISSGQDTGASLCVNINGDENVVDIWRGYADASTAEPWERNTAVNVFSTTKLVTNLAALMLISRGVLAPEDKVAQHWPEFAANGKSEITVGQVLAHTAGLSAWRDNMMLEDLYDVFNGNRQASAPGAAMGSRNRNGIPRPDAGVSCRGAGAKENGDVNRQVCNGGDLLAAGRWRGLPAWMPQGRPEPGGPRHTSTRTFDPGGT